MKQFNQIGDQKSTKPELKTCLKALEEKEQPARSNSWNNTSNFLNKFRRPPSSPASPKFPSKNYHKWESPC